MSRRGPQLLASTLIMAVVLSSSASASLVPLRHSVAEVLAEGCPVASNRGLGLMVAPGRVLTSAHVVAGSPKISITIDGRRNIATVVAFDSDNDLAVLKISDPAPFIPIGHASASSTGTLFVHHARELKEVSASVRRVVDIRTEDIYGDGKHLRSGFELAVGVTPGDSGSVFVADGHAVAVVWARTRGTDGTTWTVDPAPIAAKLGSSEPVENGHC
jgi:S1-C subfamily serine protease